MAKYSTVYSNESMPDKVLVCIQFDDNISVWHLMLDPGYNNNLWHSTSYVYICCSMCRVPRSLQGCKSRSYFSNGENERKPPRVSERSQKQTLYS